MADFTGRVVLKLRDDVQLPYQDGVQTLLDAPLAAAWEAVSATLGVELSLDRALSEVDAAQLQNLVDQAQQGRPGELPSLPSLTRFFAVVAPQGIDVEQLANAIAQLEFVDVAYAEQRTTLPAPPSQNPDDPQFSAESYLQPSPLGVNALTAWLESNGDGEGARLIDIEEDWSLAHGDLPSVTVGPGQRGGDIEHGTNVLGIIVALPENQLDCIGIAPATSVEVISVFRQNGTFDAQSALVAATLELLPLDPAAATPVILIEQQSATGAPVEVEPLFSAAIAAVVGLGIAVVEPTGNGGVDLDAFTPAPGVPNPFDRPQGDSGAIMVGACFGPSHSPMLERMRNTTHGSSSFGGRLDCFAQGDEVVTLSADPANTVTTQFGGTSSASAIVAAAACCVSAMHTAQFGVPVTPLLLRSLLSDASVNTQSATPAQDKIGVMPNLNAIIRHGV